MKSKGVKMDKKTYPPLDDEKRDLVNEPTPASSYAVSQQALTPTQLYLLRVFSHDHSEETAKRIQNLVYQYYQDRMDQELDELWEEGVLDQQKLDEYRTMHIRDILK